jgi:hypothetical protein
MERFHKPYNFRRQSGVTAEELQACESVGSVFASALKLLCWDRLNSPPIELILTIDLWGWLRKNELVGWTVSICSWRWRGSDHSRVLTSRDPSSCLKIEYSVSNKCSTDLIGKVTLIQSFAGLYWIWLNLMFSSRSHAWTCSRVSSVGLTRWFTSSAVRYWPYRVWPGSETICFYQ